MVDEAYAAMKAVAHALRMPWGHHTMQPTVGPRDRWFLHYWPDKKKTAKQLARFLEDCGFDVDMEEVAKGSIYSEAPRQPFRLFTVLVHTGTWKEWFR